MFAALFSILTLGLYLRMPSTAQAQVNTFCAANLACTVTAAWNFTGGLQSGGVSVLTNPVNLATQVSGTLAGANYAAVNLAAGNVNGGVSGVLPGASMAATNLAGGNNPGGVTGTLPNANLTTQGTDANLLTSGTVSASTGVVLCTDANHGATTSGCTPSGVSEAIVQMDMNTSGAASIGEQLYMRKIFVNSHTLIRFQISTTIPPAGCTTSAVLAFWDNTAGSAVTSLTFVNGTTFYDSGALSIALTAGHTFDTKVTTADNGCTTQPTFSSVVNIQ